MTIKTLEGGRYKVDIRPQGRAGKRVQRIFTKKADAVAFERSVMLTANNEQWRGESKDFRSLSDVYEIWWNYQGRNLKYASRRNTTMTKMIKDMGNPAIYQITSKLLGRYRSDRLQDGVKASTINRDLNLLMGMFTFLAEIGEFSQVNPIKSLGKLKEEKPEMAYLTERDITKLLESVSGDYWRITVLCLSTGARWGEATQLRAENLLHGRVTFTKTKNGKHRTVPISDEVMKAIKVKDSGVLFNVDYMAYRSILKAVKPDLPNGQAVHVLRHTFAAHFMMNGGNILTLQNIMGHSNIQQTMTYAHFAPDYLNEAISCNPLKGNIHIPSTSLGYNDT
ncbi:tyrosine-type recombinase/integrase [Providencia alcalifaciens]|uniref:Site-specific recombinase, phage integrase family n=1 Tax=Providencia alcalifaciens 205/92 TaxID=1256988 RepID=A0AAV3M733_9GAMM|nr:tyrosine-type recombinase/integrase [Providencia alcalifaciens]EUD11772.1 site-specific recombinase, phage integrase family [Providencia alcalifaciens 205/92]MTC16722.1 tyrosine-type recombinase/integrase [Providencia alcalifaciens]MTC25917.1 tyrosine-type recombinase/integrase [Providencia alcalifaciens]MTC63171.1 tyrosine-type recombinase/integrase [Providencia alcalifaciens]WGZ54372.1 tyrosine-type recombinase/integrase [Providencia alcalifaciens]